jgi:hypothetical protein
MEESKLETDTDKERKIRSIADDIESELIGEAFGEGCAKALDEARVYLDRDAEMSERIKAG